MQQDDLAAKPRAPMFWIVFGWATHGLFAVTVYYLFFYLRGSDSPTNVTSLRAALTDAALASQFATIHSVLLLPSVRERLTCAIPSPAYGVFFCFCTCLSLLATIGWWCPFGATAWNLVGAQRTAMHAAFYATWVALLYSLWLTGLGYQTGWTPWRNWTVGRAVPRREFRPRGAYRFFRHPVYLSFMGLIWFTPCMTFDRVVLTAVWTAYIFFGSYLKDQRLIHYLGDRYRAYQARVPGYPGISIGPLARVPRHLKLTSVSADA